MAVSADADGTVLDRRRLELIEPGVPRAPIHEGGRDLDDVALAEMIVSTRASARRATDAALVALAEVVGDDVTLAQATEQLGDRADAVLDGPRRRLGPPWTKDHRTALAAAILAG